MNKLLQLDSPIDSPNVIHRYHVFPAADFDGGSNKEDELNSSLADVVDGLLKAFKGVVQVEPDFPSDGLTPTVRKRVDALREIQIEHDKIKAAFSKERAALLFDLELKYQKLYERLYSQRYKIVNGEFDGAQAEAASDETDGKDEKGVPSFWLTAMKTHEIFDDVILERDEDALKYLKDIKSCLIDDPESFKLEFVFDINPYFTNSVLTKEYHMIYVDEPIVKSVIGTNIEWNPGKCLTQKVFVKKTKTGLDNAKPITKTEKCESFFNFFSPPEVPADEDIDEEKSEELRNQLLHDYDIGSTIRYKIIPHAVSWFTSEADSEGTEELEDDEEEQSIPPGGATAEGEGPPECDQQHS